MSAVVLFVLFFVILLFGLPISVTMGISSILPWVVDNTFAANLVMVLRQMMSGVNSLTLLAIPMFMLSGTIMARGGISKKLFDVFTVDAPQDDDRGEQRPEAVQEQPEESLSPQLPHHRLDAHPVLPSAGGVVDRIDHQQAAQQQARHDAGNEHIAHGGARRGAVQHKGDAGGDDAAQAAGHRDHSGGKLFGIAQVDHDRDSHGAHSRHCGRGGAGDSPVEQAGDDDGTGHAADHIAHEISNIATPTEAAVISVYYALFVSVFIYKTIKVSEIPAVFMESLKTIAPILFVLSAAVSFGRVLALMNVPQMVGAWITSSFSSKWTILLVVNIFLLFVGMVMDAAPAILILTPILAPVMTAIGVDLVHFGIMMVVNLAVGFVTPPVGINLFVASSMTKIPVIRIAKVSLPFTILFAIGLVLIVIFPQISLCLIR